MWHYVAWLVTDASPDVGDDGRVLINPKKHEQVLNVAQDLSHAVAGTPTSKHVGTALHARHEGDQKQGDSDTVEPVWELHQLSGCSEVYYNHDRSS